jgi:hypothetical protein
MSWHRELTTVAVAARFFEQVVQQLQYDGKAAESTFPPPRMQQAGSYSGLR